MLGFVRRKKELEEIHTSAGLREQFLADPLGVGRGLGFGAAETRWLEGMSDAQLNSYAASLHKKRLEQACKLLPLTCRALGPDFHEAFRAYTRSRVPARLVKKHLGDALAFATFLEKLLRRERREPRWLLDVLHYERSRIKAANPRRHVVVALFRHDVSRLVRSLARKEREAAVLARRCLAVWGRTRRGGVVRYAVYFLPSLKRRK
jgi:hypothetical protein